MELAYGLPIHRVPNLLIKGAKNEPVDDMALARNNAINRIQKRSNPLIGKIQSSTLKRLKPADY